MGTSVVNLGLGIGSFAGYGVGLLGGSSSVSPAISLSYEKGLRELESGYLGVGALVGYQGATYSFGGGDKWHYTDLLLSVHGAFHYALVPHLDTYAGLGLGLRYLRTSFDGSLAPASSGDASAQLAGFIGARYFFGFSLGAFTELGYHQTVLKVGLTARF